MARLSFFLPLPAIACLLVASWPALPSAQVRVYSSSERIELINENLATPPRIDGEQLHAPRPVQPPVTPHSAENSHVRQLEQQARASPSSSRQPPGSLARSPAEAAWLLGLLNLHGIGTGFNPVQAREWFLQAQRQGFALASAGLAWCAIDGCGQQPEPAAARPWITQLRKVDAGRAHYLEWLMNQALSPLQIASPTAPEVPARSPSQSLLLAVRSGDAYAENELGIYYAEHERLGEARGLFIRAGKTSAAAQANAEWVDWKSESKALIDAPPKNPNAQELFLRARQFHRGDRIPVNYAEALRLYRQAASLGNPHAQKMLALIYSRPLPTGDLNVLWMQQLASVDVTKEGSPTLLAPAPSPALQRDATPLLDYIPSRLRRPNQQRP